MTRSTIGQREAIAGFYVLEAKDLHEATQLALGNPILRQGGGLAIRPVQ